MTAMPRLWTAAAAFLVLATAGAQASSDTAWANLDKAAIKTCKAEISRLASKAKVTAVSARVSGIGASNDPDRFYALTLRGKMGRYDQNWLCLYEKRTHKAVAREQG